jgi:hypothetical protein
VTTCGAAHAPFWTKLHVYRPPERGAIVSKKNLVAAGATAVAAVTLGLGLGGAYASGKGKMPKPQRGTVWAVVKSDGTLVRRSKDIASVLRIAPGQYRVFAKGNVRNCAYLANGGDVGLGIPPRTYADVAQGFNDTRSVFVETYDSTGTRVDSDFYLAILC